MLYGNFNSVPAQKSSDVSYFLFIRLVSHNTAVSALVSKVLQRLKQT